MKTRIVDNKPIANYTDEWLLNNNNNIVNGSLVSDWEVVKLYNGDFVKPLFNGVDWVEAETQENINHTKKEVYKNKINDYFSIMYIRALSSSMNKRSSDINYLLGLREEYEDKYNVSKGIVTSGVNYDSTQEAILGEMEDEFTEAYLDTRLPLYGLPIEGTHLDKMYAIIVFKYEYGLNAFNSFNKFIRRFRTKCNSWVDSSEFTKLDNAFAIVEGLPDSLSVADAEVLYNDFNLI